SLSLTVPAASVLRFLSPLPSSSCFFFSSRRRHTRFSRDWSSDVCSSDLPWLKRIFRFRTLLVILTVGALTLLTFAYLTPFIHPRSEERRVGKEYIIRG